EPDTCEFRQRNTEPRATIKRPETARVLKRLVKVVQWHRQGVPLSAFWRGLVVRRHFRRAGVILSLPGGPLPIVKNRGGGILAEGCTFEAGVRLEVYPGATLTIGKGTYFNRNVHIVVADSVSIGQGVRIGWDTVIMDTDLHGLSGQ